MNYIFPLLALTLSGCASTRHLEIYNSSSKSIHYCEYITAPKLEGNGFRIEPNRTATAWAATTHSNAAQYLKSSQTIAMIDNNIYDMPNEYITENEEWRNAFWIWRITHRTAGTLTISDNQKPLLKTSTIECELLLSSKNQPSH